ncbi:hypothetical protein L596_030438 [Steinernema carpocapsae]|uniref:Peptidase S1 domain-containing protein n=1 Tax=Steinernema carpocapsae TaxID=34508 RepID=A0A4U5LPF9_STECR|nr:hypothetical protein L596_030438 [Steinernema carpocapsae]
MIGIVTLANKAEITDYVKTIKIKADDKSLLSLKDGFITGYGTHAFENGWPEDSANLLFVQIPQIAQHKCR